MGWHVVEALSMRPNQAGTGVPDVASEHHIVVGHKHHHLKQPGCSNARE
jgi:hypothetical protein